MKRQNSEEKIHFSRKRAKTLAWIVAWLWTVVAGGGGLWLLLTKGPLPLTNGWFAFFSGVAACPLIATLSQKYFGITISGRIQFAGAALFWLAGRIALALGI
jgi:hypothetical protein